MIQGCNLTGNVSILIQGTLFTFVSLLMFYKRSQEKPMRSLEVFFLDIAKQTSGGFLVHAINVLMSHESRFQCGAYLFVLTFDTFVGLLVNYFLLKALSSVAEKRGLKNLLSGNYFTDLNPLDKELMVGKNNKDKRTFMIIDYKIWFFQTLLWCGIVLISKAILYSAEEILSFMNEICHNLISYLPVTTRLVFVLFLAPVISNALVYWVQDNFLKKNDFNDEESVLLYNYFYESESAMEKDTNTTALEEAKKDQEELSEKNEGIQELSLPSVDLAESNIKGDMENNISNIEKENEMGITEKIEECASN